MKIPKNKYDNFYFRKTENNTFIYVFNTYSNKGICEYNTSNFDVINHLPDYDIYNYDDWVLGEPIRYPDYISIKQHVDYYWCLRNKEYEMNKK